MRRDVFPPIDTENNEVSPRQAARLRSRCHAVRRHPHHLIVSHTAVGTYGIYIITV